MDRGAWYAIVHRVAKSRTGLKRLSTHAERNRINITSQTIWLFFLSLFGFLRVLGLMSLGIPLGNVNVIQFSY